MTSTTASRAISNSLSDLPRRWGWRGESAPFYFVRMAMSREGAFLAVTLAACALAAGVAAFQYAVFASFLRASAVMPLSIQADFWVTGASVECFDFPYPIAEDHDAALAGLLPGASYRRVVFGFVPWRSPSGRRGNVAIVGVDGGDLPPDSFAADQSDLGRLDLLDDAGKPAFQAEATFGDRTLRLADSRTDMASFLGAPYVRVPFETGRQLLRMDPGTVSFLAGNFRPEGRTDPAAVQARVMRMFPDIVVVSGKQFQDSSAQYWLRKTGAGMAILLAAVLASVLMAILLANGIMRFFQRFEQDLLSLLGHGASEREVSSIVRLVAAVIGAITVISMLIFTPIAIKLAQPFLPWVEFHFADMRAPILAIACAVGFALLSARRAIAAYGPAAVFRS